MDSRSPNSFRRRWARARADTRWLELRTDIVPAVLAGLVTFGVSFGLLGSSGDFGLPILLSALVVIVYFVVINSAEFVWHFAVAGYKNEISDLRNGAAAVRPHANHLRDLQEFAHHQQELLNDRMHRNIELGTALGRSLSVHYPEVGVLAATWNNLNVTKPRQRAYECVEREATRLGLRDTPALNLLAALTTYLDFSELSWQTQGKEVIVSRGDDINTRWAIPAPDAKWAETIRAELYDAAAHIRELPEIRASLEIQAQYKQLKSELLARLDFIERNHNLSYRAGCELCAGTTEPQVSGRSTSNTGGSQS